MHSNKPWSFQEVSKSFLFLNLSLTPDSENFMTGYGNIADFMQYIFLKDDKWRAVEILFYAL